MNRQICLMALLLALGLTAGCNLKEIQLNKRLNRWDKMLASGENEDKMYEFATESIYFFLTNGELQRTKETAVTEQERLIYHRRMTSMQTFLISYHARKALEAVDRPDPDWELGRREWIMADTCAMGKVPGYLTNFSLVHVQDGYEKLMVELVIHPDKYPQLARDYPELMAGLRQMSRFKYLEAQMYQARGYYDKALDDYLNVFIMDPDNYPAADEIVRKMTGRGIKQTVAQRFMKDRYEKTFVSDRLEAHDMTAAALNKVMEEHGGEVPDSALYAAAANVAQNFNITPEHNLDFYYYVQAYNNGNLPEYLRMWRHVVLEGNKPLRAQYSE